MDFAAAGLPLYGSEMDVEQVGAFDIAPSAVNGGILAPGSVETEHIVPEGLNAMTALGDATVIAAKLAEGAVTAPKLAVGGLSNLISNPSFEVDPLHSTVVTGWTLSQWGACSGAAIVVNGIADTASVIPDGQQYLAFLTGSTGDCEVVSDQFAVAPGQLVAASISAYVAGGILSVEFLDAAGVWVASSYFGTAPGGAWTRIGGVATAPAGAVWARLLLQGSSIGAWYAFDNAAVMTGGTLIDSSGIYIFNGRLVFIDANGSTILSGAGFGPQWVDYIHSGIFNSQFAEATPGALALGATDHDPIGQTAALPHWTAWRPAGSGSTLTVAADATYPGGHYVRADFSATGVANAVCLTSDLVPIYPGSLCLPAGIWDKTVGGGEMTALVSVAFYDSAGSGPLAFASPPGGPSGYSYVSGAMYGYVYPLSQAVRCQPIGARYARITLKVWESVGHSAGNHIYFAGAALLPAVEGTAFDQGQQIEVGSVNSQGSVSAYTGLSSAIAGLSVATQVRAAGMTPSSYTANSGGNVATTCTAAGTYYFVAGHEVTISPAYVGQRFLVTLNAAIGLVTATAQECRLRLDVTDAANALKATLGYAREQHVTTGALQQVAITAIYTADVAGVGARKIRVSAMAGSTAGVSFNTAYTILNAIPLPND